MWSESSIIGCESLPQAEESLLSYDVGEDEHSVGFNTGLLHAGLDNINGHTGNGCDQTREHTGTEVE